MSPSKLLLVRTTQQQKRLKQQQKEEETLKTIIHTVQFMKKSLEKEFQLVLMNKNKKNCNQYNNNDQQQQQQRIHDLLQQLDKQPITNLTILSETLIGKVVTKIKKYYSLKTNNNKSEMILIAAKKLIRKWKDVVVINNNSEKKKIIVKKVQKPTRSVVEVVSSQRHDTVNTYDDDTTTTSGSTSNTMTTTTHNKKDHTTIATKKEKQNIEMKAVSRRLTMTKPTITTTTTKCVNVKVKYIRPQGYQNLKEWVEDPSNNNNHVYIGRKGIVFINNKRYPSQDSIWCNPIKITKNKTRNIVLQEYETYIRNRLKEEPNLCQKLINDLQGKQLGCWCKPEKCHGDILIKILLELQQATGKKDVTTIATKKEKQNIATKTTIATTIIPRTTTTTTTSKCVNVTIKHIYPQGYQNLKEWVEDSSNNNVYIGRKGIVFINNKRYPLQDSIWCNPIKMTKGKTRNIVLQEYETYIRNKLKKEPYLYQKLINDLHGGKQLGCWCKPGKCHGDILIKILNEQLQQQEAKQN